MKTKLKAGDKVVIIAGGNSQKRPIVGKIGVLKGFAGKDHDRVFVEGLNMVTRHVRATGPSSPGGKVMKEASVHISNVAFYSEELKRKVKLTSSRDVNGKWIRGYRHPESKGFVSLDSTSK